MVSTDHDAAFVVIVGFGMNHRRQEDGYECSDNERMVSIRHWHHYLFLNQQQREKEMVETNNTNPYPAFVGQQRFLRASEGLIHFFYLREYKSRSVYFGIILLVTDSNFRIEERRNSSGYRQKDLQRKGITIYLKNLYIIS